MALANCFRSDVHRECSAWPAPSTWTLCGLRISPAHAAAGSACSATRKFRRRSSFHRTLCRMDIARRRCAIHLFATRPTLLKTYGLLKTQARRSALTCQHRWPAGWMADGSRTVTQKSLLRSRQNQTLQIEDAQSPAISADGRSLAYLREIEGRNQIYLRRLDLPESSEQRIISSSLNVNEMTMLRDGSIIFSASTKTSAPEPLPGRQERYGSEAGAWRSALPGGISGWTMARL